MQPKRYITVDPQKLKCRATLPLPSPPSPTSLGCVGPYKVQETRGVFNDVFCDGNDSVFNFLEDVLDEGQFLCSPLNMHVGADECPKESWKHCPTSLRPIKDLGLKDEHELQSYFT